MTPHSLVTHSKPGLRGCCADKPVFSSRKYLWCMNFIAWYGGEGEWKNTAELDVLPSAGFLQCVLWIFLVHKISQMKRTAHHGGKYLAFLFGKWHTLAFCASILRENYLSTWAGASVVCRSRYRQRKPCWVPVLISLIGENPGPLPLWGPGLIGKQSSGCFQWPWLVGRGDVAETSTWQLVRGTGSSPGHWGRDSCLAPDGQRYAAHSNSFHSCPALGYSQRSPWTSAQSSFTEALDNKPSRGDLAHAHSWAVCSGNLSPEVGPPAVHSQDPTQSPAEWTGSGTFAGGIHKYEESGVLASTSMPWDILDEAVGLWSTGAI